MSTFKTRSQLLKPEIEEALRISFESKERIFVEKVAGELRLRW